VNLVRVDRTAIRGCSDLLGKLSQIPHVTGTAPAIFNPVFVASRMSNQGAMLKGVDPVRERDVSDFFSHVIEGDPDALQKTTQPLDPDAPRPPENIIIGKEMAKAMGARIGDTVRVVYPMGTLTPLGMTVSEKTFRVAAVFESGLWDYDSNWIYAAMPAAQRLFSLPRDSCSVLQFKTDDMEEAEAVADSIRAAAGPGVTTYTWIELNRPLFSALKLEKLALFLTISLIVFVASLNIVTTLIMMVLEKQRDIAILTAMGATSRLIMTVFMLQGVIIGVIGTLLGALLGTAACWILDTYKLIQLQAEIYSIPYVPFHVRGLDVLLVSGTSILISFLATLYPARSASQLNPVEVLRYE
jgi:lipoprotein-releasing system permease protein